jgi:hypothetical protein
MEPAPSIHFRRRYFYALWAGLFLLSLGALILWETPASTATSRVELRVQIKGLPAGVQARVWVGPRGQWRGKASQTEGTPVPLPANGPVVVPPQTVWAGYRRWVKGFIPRRTADLVVLCFQESGQPDRFLPFPLAQDWRSGMLGPRRVLRIGCECNWKSLRQDPAAVTVTE